MAYFPRSIMQRAWCVARAAAKRFGGKASAYLPASLRQSWAEAKAAAARIAGQQAAVLASIASLPADIAAEAAYMARFYAKQTAVVLPFPARPAVPVLVPALVPMPLRRAA